MVRFIIRLLRLTSKALSTIYIPIWLDLLCSRINNLYNTIENLHSNMVRFIIFYTSQNKNLLETIYIPIWLDLLFKRVNIHCKRKNLFTFQYG